MLFSGLVKLENLANIFFSFFSRIDLGLCSSLAAIRILKGLSEYSDNEGQKALMLSYARKESIKEKNHNIINYSRIKTKISLKVRTSGEGYFG